VKRGSRSPVPSEWENLPEADLLKLRVRDLGLQLSESPLREFIERLYGELESRAILFRPPCYLADEWFCPDGAPIIGIPFCLAHPRLKQLEQKMMLEVEGGTEESCMKLLRHECGHAINYAYRFYGRTRWRQLFGPMTTRYSSTYSFRPYSKRFVLHLADNYAQAHPDEDFAETFAVWLTPDSRWQEKYRDWPALKKLRYVDTLMRTTGRTPPKISARETPYAASRMTSSLAAHYERKREYLRDEFPGYYDPSLQRLFADGSQTPDRQRASRLLRAHRRRITNSVAAWTGHRKYDIDQLLRKLIKRCDALDLRVKRNDEDMLVGVTAFVSSVTTRMMRYVPAEKHR
jgi:hypothetical protein